MQKHIDDITGDSQKRLENDVIAEAAELAELANQAVLDTLNGVEQDEITVKQLQDLLMQEVDGTLGAGRVSSEFKSVVAKAAHTSIMTALATLLFDILSALPSFYPFRTLPPDITIKEIFTQFIADNPNRAIRKMHIRKIAGEFVDHKAEKYQELQQQIGAELREFLKPDQLTSGLPEAVGSAVNAAARKHIRTTDH